VKREPLIPLLLFSSVIISGCASTLATPSQPSVTPARREPMITPALPPPPLAVTLTTTKATTHYSVRGTTTSTIFEEIEANGLVEIDGKRAMGLAVANSEVKLNAREIVERWSRGWRRFENDDGPLCTPESVTITLNLVVTLPRHERLGDLSNDLRERWQHFASAVAAHEQRHVDIFLNRANALKARIEAALKNWASCADVEATLRSLWASHEAETKDAQREFDAEDRARILNDRKPLQADIETRRARLTALTTEVRQLDATLEDLSRRTAAVRGKIDAVNTEIAKANGTCSQPTERIQRLCRQYNALVVTHNALVAEHSSVVDHRNALAGEHNALVESINGLIEALNWVI
jgi:predicted secreted Zn-dependent protease